MRPDLGPHDVHIVVNTVSDLAKCFVPGEAEPRWVVPCRNEGVAGPGWDRPYGDTPPGLWEVVRVEEIPPGDPDINAYGPVYLWLQELEGQAASVGRAGIGWHGGGSGLPAPLAPRQGWQVTHGCLRSQNVDLTMRVVPTVRYTHARGGRVWLTVSRDQ
jgi:hypothetical protein